MRFSLVFLALGLLAACSPTTESQGAPQASRTARGFPLPDRPVAGIVAPEWSSGPDRDAADESGQLIRGLRIGPGMKVADIGAGSGYHTLRLSPAVGPTGTVYAEDIVEAYISGLRREAERRKLTNIRIVVGTADDPKLPAKTIDRAVLVHMYHEVENPYALLWNLAGSLKPGALVGVIDLDRGSGSHGMPPALLKCEFEAVGYKQLSSEPMAGGVGYLAIFEAPKARPRPQDIRGCKAG
ncbi:MAG: methyltransferase domain-containing protein [Phenylobacterium sp.]|uniref:class I SAM-dependent methyltransferase n=1 Tax=Phenylobacterium sp. TaxID=1871053 RepID=UPI0012170737|nr:class I SAM-dependent methyltransferase [Phenylobacterium sp.]TAJ69122.1 MAG: methyltransferase domain-containing protein [Phenylobacterium sp.]